MNHLSLSRAPEAVKQPSAANDLDTILTRDTIRLMIDIPREDFEALKLTAAQLAPQLSRNEGVTLDAADTLHLAIVTVREFCLLMARGDVDDLEAFLRGPYRVMNFTGAVDRAIAALLARRGGVERMAA